MAVDFNDTKYTGTQVGAGDVVNSKYTGESFLDLGTTLTLNGSVSQAGNTVSVNVAEFGVNLGTYQVAYEGYFVAPGGADVFVFEAASIPGIGKLSFTVSSQPDAYGFDFGQPVLPGTPAMPCFLRGTRIAVADGEAAVETLQIGDLVATRVEGRTVLRPITWVGSRTADLSRGTHDQDAYPVRIRAGAFADSVPQRDLLVTSEHCILVDGRFVPVRMLVNGASIRIETDLARFEYFHVETEQHSVLVAEGLETESFLDTGNRARFANASVTALRPGAAPLPESRSWADAAAPLDTAQGFVQPVWQRLADRASALGLDLPQRPALAQAPAIRLLTETGLELLPFHVDGATYDFAIPAGTSSLRLLSGAARPSDVAGPFVDDRRTLGVKVGKLGLAIGARRVASGAHLADAPLSGWHAMEPAAPARWTNGDAVLPIDLSAAARTPVILSVEVLDAMPTLADRRAA